MVVKIPETTNETAQIAAPIQWMIDEKPLTNEHGTTLIIRFPGFGYHKLEAVYSDAKNGAIKKQSVTFMIIPPYFYLLIVTAGFLLLILALFRIFSYSRPRASRHSSKIFRRS